MLEIYVIIYNIKRQGGIFVARCPYLEYDGGRFFSYDDYYCKLCKKGLSESEVKYKCNPDYGEDYKNCQIYKDR